MNPVDLAIHITRDGGVLVLHATAHGVIPGEKIRLHRGSRWKDLWNILVRPRHYVVDAVTADTMSLREERMTWPEWRRTLWRTLKP